MGWYFVTSILEHASASYFLFLKCPEDGGSKFLKIVNAPVTIDTASYPRRLESDLPNNNTFGALGFYYVAYFKAEIRRLCKFIQIAKNLTLSEGKQKTREEGLWAFSFAIHGTHKSVSLLNMEGLLKSPGAIYSKC